MRNCAYTFLGLLSLVIGACGPEPRPTPDAEDCAAFFDETAIPEACDGVCMDLATNRENCGWCGNACGNGANACVGGQCVCAASDGSHHSKAPCTFPAVCDETGWCLTPDPAGAWCDEIDGVYCPASDPQRVCVAGYCTVPDCDNPETCNLRDDDCDGLTDQTDVGQPLAQTCYAGDPTTANVGICRPGQELCVAGGWTPCNGEQLPVPEDGFLRCDGLDNDCDACADNQLNDDGVCEPLPPLKADVVFIIDRSGSMSGTIAAVVSAVQSWASTIGTNPNIRFALVDPTATYDVTDGIADGVKVDLGLSDYMTFNAVMATLSANGSGTEPMHYATQLVMNGTYDAALGFAPDSIRIIIAIHDETTAEAWSGNTVAGYDETTVCGSVPANTVLAVITYPSWFTEWDLCTSSVSMPPTAMPLSSDPAVMLANLNLIIETPCF